VAHVIKDALHARFVGVSVDVLGFSRGGKASSWAVSSTALHVGSKPFDHAYILMGGTLGPGSVKLVGACAEGFPAMVDRWPMWFGARAKGLPTDTSSWPYDVADYMVAGCHSTQYTFSLEWDVQWKNWIGCMHTIHRMRAAGCRVRVVQGEAPDLALRMFLGALDEDSPGS